MDRVYVYIVKIGAAIGALFFFLFVLVISFFLLMDACDPGWDIIPEEGASSKVDSNSFVTDDMDCLEILSSEENLFGIKDFNYSFVFRSMYEEYIDIDSTSETNWGLSFAKFNIDSMGRGYVDFNLVGLGSSRACIVSSYVDSLEGIVFLNFTGENVNRPADMLIGLEWHRYGLLDKQIRLYFLYSTGYVKYVYL